MDLLTHLHRMYLSRLQQANDESRFTKTAKMEPSLDDFLLFAAAQLSAMNTAQTYAVPMNVGLILPDNTRVTVFPEMPGTVDENQPNMSFRITG